MMQIVDYILFELEFHLFSIHAEKALSSREFYVSFITFSTPYRDGSLFCFKTFKMNNPYAKPVREFDLLWAGLWLPWLKGE